MRAVLKAQINKTDRNDARGIAQMMRVNCGAKYFGKAMISQARSASAKAAAYPISTPSYSSAPPNSPTRQPSFAVWLVK
jgi:hypothetical protein